MQIGVEYLCVKHEQKPSDTSRVGVSCSLTKAKVCGGGGAISFSSILGINEKVVFGGKESAKKFFVSGFITTSVFYYNLFSLTSSL